MLNLTSVLSEQSNPKQGNPEQGNPEESNPGQSGAKQGNLPWHLVLLLTVLHISFLT